MELIVTIMWCVTVGFLALIGLVVVGVWLIIRPRKIKDGELNGQQG